MPSVSSSKATDAEAVVEDTTRVQEDVDAVFKETVTRAITKVQTKEAIEKPTMDDQNKTFRTRLVALWMLSNATLAIAIENIDGLPNTKDPSADQASLAKKQNTYFSIILYSTFALALVRFIGVCLHRLVADITHFPSCSACTTSLRGTYSDAVGETELRAHIVVLLSFGLLDIL